MTLRSRRFMTFLAPMTVILMTLSVACNSSSTESGGRRSAATSPDKTAKDSKNGDASDEVTLEGSDDGEGVDDGSTDKGDAEPADERCYKGDPEVCAAEYKIFELTNKVREGRGLEPLKFSAKASFVARDWSKQQAEGGFISHSGFPSARQSDYQQEFSAKFSGSGENVAMTGGGGDPAEEFVDMWVNSFGHLRNMLGDHEVLGVGISQGSGGWYATQLFGFE